MEARWHRLDPDEPIRPFGVISDLNDLEHPNCKRVWSLQGLEIWRIEIPMPHPTTLEPMAGVKIMANWGMIPRNQG
jgi:hypothetical protein